jgi:hypothetical protein
MVSKRLIDKVFTDEYDTILKETKYWVSYCTNSTAEAEDYISSAYQFIINNKNKISNKEKDVKNYIFRFIIDNVRWYNSNINKTNRRLNDGNYKYIDELTPEEDIIDDEYDLYDNEDYQYKIAAIEIYNQQCSKEDRIIYQVYSSKDKRTVRSMAEHLNIRHTQSWIKITQMKSGIKKIYNDLKNNNNNKNI